MLKNGRNHKADQGCSCCNSKNARRAGKKGAKADEKRRWRREEGLR